ncbi:MAG: SMC-Scp complex subunit ScpB [Candidatus Pacebacteria bacterium]|nr:SMC-Scp complex subunit ScpB [Candidatus Paceibacterota bacterium]
MDSLEQALEAILFYIAEPITGERLAAIMSVTIEEIDDAAAQLAGSLAERGIRVLHVNGTYELVTAPEVSDAIAALRKEALSRDLGKAGAETLSVILYRGPLTRIHIEQIRGLNCSYILRALLIRGLIEKQPAIDNPRIVLYHPSPMLLRHLGVTSVEVLPEYEKIRSELMAFEAGTLPKEDVPVVQETKVDIV